MTDNDEAERPNAPPGLLALFIAFAQISMTSFGGGVSAIVHGEFVRTRRWITETEFIAGLSLSQALPGVNITNLAIWIGYRLRGSLGALVALLGVVVPSAIIIILVGAIIAELTRYPLIGLALAGVAAAATGLSLNMGLIVARRAFPDIASVIILAATIVAGLCHVSILLIFAVAAPISIGLAYLKLRHE
ncbi:chromate transporter [Chelatococcus sp. GCM10030263]|uniref:chromate transporter n=1 Tax=Chelatococcus sp. GCM10030263 TaxID=3273387 RepID=UPI003607C58B